MSASNVSRDQNTAVSVAPSINPAAYLTGASPVNGASADLLGYGGAFATLVAGTRTDGTHALKLQDSADNSTFADVAAGNLSGAFAADVVSNTVVKVAYLGSKRYLRAVATVSGTTTGAVYGATITRTGPATQPTPNP